MIQFRGFAVGFADIGSRHACAKWAGIFGRHGVLDYTRYPAFVNTQLDTRKRAGILSRMDELWKDTGVSGYQVSNFGRVSSVKRGRLRMLRPTAGNNGYLSVSLYRDGQEIRQTVHRLVALAFLGAPPTLAHELNHLDGARANNRADNLAWVTSSENNRHRYDVLGARAARGSAHGMAKLTEDGIRDIRARRLSGASLSTIAREFGIKSSTVQDIVKGRTWGWLP